ncbi:MAG TPA: glycosyltransferase family 4 protein [Candidatus Dormibacteraeota bacterium]|nr:glycosyltransferase family 4 protein [Candidatus Dormibacteraeota bacterium]
MRICQVSPYDFMHPGGVTEHVRHLSQQLRDRGHDVTVLAPSSRVGDDHGIPGYIRIGRSVPVRSNGSVAHLALSFHLVRRVRALLSETDYDVVHYHEPLVPALPITVLRFHRGANVGTFHALARRNLGYYYGRPFLKRYFNRLHARIAVSVPARDFIARYFDGDFQVVPNGIDTSRFNPALPPVDSARTPGWLTVLFVGRMESRKGLPTLLEAFGKLRQQRSNVRLVVVGDGPMRWGYERQVEALGIPDVQFTGHVPAELLPRYYASADIFCAPATGGESFGIVLLEAMASRVAVIASSIPGFMQVVDDGITGLLAPAKQPDEWAAALHLLAADAPRRAAMGVAGMHKAQLYDWSRVVDTILQVYGDARARAVSPQVTAGVHGQVPGVG